MFKSGFVSIVGRPNVGKSTLMNNVVGEKIAIMSDKPQTTRNTIQAVYTDEKCQIVFLDTPGIHKPKNKLGEFMVKSATDAFKNVDLVLFVVDDSKKIGPGDRKIIEDLKGIKTPVVLVLNKIDKLEEAELFDLMNLYSKEDLFKEIVPISALKGRNISELLKVIEKYLEEGDAPVDMIKKAIDLGVSKINVNTECQLSFQEATRKYIEAGKDLEGKGFDPRKLLAPGAEAIRATVKEKMELFGSIGKA